MTAHAYRVVGTPAPQGSKRHVGNGRLVESSKALAPWREAVALQVGAARNLSGIATITGPARVTLTFLMKRPIHPKFPVPAVRPDIDKLIRSTCDALTTCGALTDDALIVELRANEVYAVAGHPSGAWIVLEEISQ